MVPPSINASQSSCSVPLCERNCAQAASDMHTDGDAKKNAPPKELHEQDDTLLTTAVATAITSTREDTKVTTKFIEFNYNSPFATITTLVQSLDRWT